MPHPIATDDLPITFFVSSLRLGGAERMMVQLAAATADLGLPVDLVVANATVGRRLPLPGGVELHDLGVKKVRLALGPLAAYLRRRRPFALISRVNKTNLVALAAARLSRAPVRVVVTEATHWSGWLQESSRLTRLKLRWGLLPLMRWSYPRADAVVAVSEGVADDLSHRVGIDRRRINVVRNPVVHAHLLRLASQAPSHRWLRGPRHIPVIVAVGSLRPAKDYPTLLKALRLLLRRREVRLIVYGEGSDRNALLRRTRDLGLAPHVDFPGNTDNPYAAMAACDLFVLSSRREGSPNVLVEALACGARVAATDCCSGPREILQQGRAGRLVPVGDARALADAMDHELDAPLPLPGVRRRIQHEYDSRTAALKYLAAAGYPLDRMPSAERGVRRTAGETDIQTEAVA